MVGFLGGVFGRSFWAEIFCPKMLSENVARKFPEKKLRWSNSLPQSAAQNSPKIETLTFYHIFDFLGGPYFFPQTILGSVLGRAFTRDVESLGGVFGRFLGGVFRRKFSARCPKMLSQDGSQDEEQPP